MKANTNSHFLVASKLLSKLPTYNGQQLNALHITKTRDSAHSALFTLSFHGHYRESLWPIHQHDVTLLHQILYAQVYVHQKQLVWVMFSSLIAQKNHKWQIICSRLTPQTHTHTHTRSRPKQDMFKQSAFMTCAVQRQVSSQTIYTHTHTHIHEST